MSWPMSQDFNEAVQNPRTAFSDPDLKSGEAVVGAHGMPLPRSGNFADVYQLRGPDGRDWAVKCFTRPVVGLAERYARISETLASSGLPFTVEFTYLAEGILVAGAWRPVLKMAWVEGLLLNQVMRENANNPTVLAALGQMWVKLCKRLREAGIAHADLQHGNVLLVEGSRSGAYGLKLIDYDGMYVSSLANRPAGESGHPAYQHPARNAGVYSPDLDRFPHLVIATALKALEIHGTDLWNRYDSGDNLLFAQEDFRNPAESKLMRELWATGDPGIQSLVGRVAVACGRPITQTPWLDEFAPDGVSIPLDADTRRDAEIALGLAPRSAAPKPVPVTHTMNPTAHITTKVVKTIVAEEVDEEPNVTETFDPSTQERKASRRSKHKKRSREKISGKLEFSRTQLAIGGAFILILFVGAIVLSRGSKPVGIAQQKVNEPTSSVTPHAPENEKPKPKEVTPTKPKDPIPTSIPTPTLPPTIPKDTSPTVVVEPTSTENGSVDLLAYVDPKTHTVSGDWKKDAKALIGIGGRNTVSQILLPYEPGEEYDVELTGRRVEGADALCFGLPLSGGRQVICTIDGYGDRGRATGFEFVDMKLSFENATGVKGQQLKNSTDYRFHYSVRNGKLELRVDGKAITSFKGDFSHLSIFTGHRLPNVKAMFLLIGPQTTFQIDRLLVAPVKGMGKVIK